MEYKIGNEARCAVIGYGSWATAIVGLLTANETRVGWYVRNPEVLEGLLTEGRQPRYLSDMEFDRDRIAPSDDLDGIVREADILILATPSAYLKTFLEPLTVPLKDKFVVSAIKGIVRATTRPSSSISTTITAVLQTDRHIHGPVARRGGFARKALLPDGRLHRSRKRTVVRRKIRHGLHTPELLHRPFTASNMPPS